ncbi:MAG: hypothetical protein IKP28_01485 [Clostridia bacterium]|nr:hypothetical protein [Clostridia bacterium]
MSFFAKSGIVNVKMVITEEKILSNIDKVQKLINPNSKKQIVELQEDTYFKDLIESIKTYLIEYPRKKNFPKSVYKAAYGLVEYATNQFEENTKQIEGLIRARETNINQAFRLKELFAMCDGKEDGWKDEVKKSSSEFSEDIVEALSIIGRNRTKTSQNFEDAVKLVNARINNLETNLHIEIDMERIEDRSKALSYIGIEVADALKGIPAPLDDADDATETIEATTEQAATVTTTDEEKEYIEETRFEAKPSLWQRIKESKIGRAISYVLRIKVVLQVPALPEGRGENNQ